MFTTFASSRLAIVAAAVGLTVLAATAVPAVAAPSTTRPSAPHGLGALRPNGRQRPDPLSQAQVDALPGAVDLSRWDVPVGNQQTVNSCVVWTVRDMLGWYANRAGITINSFAPMYLYSQATKGHDTGTFPNATLRLLQSQGIAPSSVYSQGDYDFRTQPSAAERTVAAQFKITSWKQLFLNYNSVGGGAADVNAIKKALAGGQPVAIALPVRVGFDALSPANAYDTDYSSAIRGYHEVMAIGYDAKGLLFENHWGTAWGNNGYGRLSWGVVGHDVYWANTMTVGWSAPTGQQWSQVRAGTGAVSTSRPVGISGVSKISAAGMHDGSTQYISVVHGQEYWQLRQANGKWTRAKRVGQAGVTSVATAATPNGQLQVTSVIGGRRYFQIRQSNGKWTKQVQVGHVKVTSVSAVGLASGAAYYDVLVKGRLFQQTRLANGRWTALKFSGAVGITSTTLATTANNGAIVEMAIHGGLEYVRKLSRGSSWTPLTSTGNLGVSAASASGFKDGSVLFVSLIRGNTYQQSLAANGTLSALTSLGNPRIMRAVASASTGDGSLQILTAQ